LQLKIIDLLELNLPLSNHHSMTEFRYCFTPLRYSMSC